MLSDSAEETPTLTMDELQLQLPRTALQPALSPSPPPPPLYSLKSSSTSSELVEFPDTGLDFYSSPFDNSFPYRGILSNERSFSCSSPNSNTSFLSETSFSKQSLLRNSHDSGIASESFGLLTATSTPYRGNDANFSLDFQRILTGGGGAIASAFSNDELAPPPGANFVPSSQALNDSMLSTSSIDCSTGLSSSLVKWSSPSKVVTSTPSNIQFDFSFPTMSEPNMGGGMCMNNDSGVGSSNGSSNSNASVDSPSRLLAAVSEAGTISCSYPSTQWSSGDAAIMGPQVPESPNDNAVVSTSAFNASIWSPSSQASAGMCNTMPNASGSMGEFVTGNNQASSNSLSLDQELKGLSKDQLVSFVELLKQKLGESLHNQDEVQANQLQSAIVEVQQHIISTFLYEPSESSGSVSTPTRTVASPIMSSPTDNSLDRQARMHREDNGSENRTKDAPYTWSGHLPPRIHRNPTYSCKVFLGGLPWDITEAILMQTFKPFGMMKIEWPGKDCVTSTRPRGYAYAVFETEKQVKLLLQNCTHDYNNCRAGNYYYKISSKKFRGKDVQIIPWAVSDSNFTRIQASKIDPLRTIFVGALHGMVNAEGLATIMNDLFGGVVYAGIDTDRSKYPIGSARVTFNNTRSYLKAVRAAFVHIKTPRFDKKLQVDPYLEDATCSICKLQQGPYFCRDTSCFSYFCRTCFQYKHSDPKLRSHNPMMRTHNKASQPQQQSVVMNSALFSGPNNRSSGFNVNHNHQNQQMSYNYSGPNNHTNTGYQGFPTGQGTTRQWNGGRNSPQGGYSGGGQCPPTYGFNGIGGGVGNKFPHNNGVHFGGGCNNNGNNFPHQNKFFGQVGHRQQQQQQYNRW